MKYIKKNVEPQVLVNLKEKANADWQPTYDNDLRGSDKEEVKKSLMAEQGYICCYCERELTDDDSHIEHFKPQSAGVDSLDFGNMLCSCLGASHSRREPRHCGFKKDNWHDDDPTMMVSPLDKNCEARFKYLGDGRIEPETKSDQGAKETIRRLGLDIPKLNDMRGKSIEPFLDEDLSSDDMRTFVSGYLKKKSSGRFGEFWTTIKYLFT